MKARHKRFGIVVVGLAALGLATFLVLNALEGNLSYFFSPTEVAKGEAPVDHVFRLGGLVDDAQVFADLYDGHQQGHCFCPQHDSLLLSEPISARVGGHRTSTMSSGRQVWSIQGCSGPYMRRASHQLFPGIVCSQFPSFPSGGLGAK